MPDLHSDNATMTTADRIRQLRKERGLTQEDLAAKAGLGVATIQRLERGESPSLGTIASVAAAFGLKPEALTTASGASAAASAVGSYLPLKPITSGKHLIDLVAASSAFDFDYMEVGDDNAADLLSRLYEFCRPRQDFKVPSNPGERIRLDLEASKLIKELAAKSLTLSGGTYMRTGHEVDDDGMGTPMLLAQWDETCLVLRVGTDGTLVDRADVESRMDEWTNTNDPQIVRPERHKTDNSEPPF